MPVYVSFAAGLELKVRAVLSISDRADHVESPPTGGRDRAAATWINGKECNSFSYKNRRFEGFVLGWIKRKI